MIGVILSSFGTLFDEVSDSIVKSKSQNQEKILYIFGFQQLFFGILAFASLVLVFGRAFHFSPASLPPFLVRAFLEVLQLHVTLLAISRADRSTYGFLRVGTLPLLLVVDLILGYHLNLSQFVGISVIVLSFVLIFLGQRVGKKSIGLVLFTMFNAVATISLYKYDITHFNSVAVEQIGIYFSQLLYFLSICVLVYRLNPFISLFKPVFLAQSLTAVGGFIFDSFSYLFVPASVLIAAKRASGVLWSTFSGSFYFREKHFLLKFGVVSALGIGIVLLAL